MPSESSFGFPASSGIAIPSAFEMDLDEDVKNEDFLGNFNDFDMFLPGASDEDLLESRFSLDHPLFDSLLNDDHQSDWPNFLNSVSSQKDEDAFIKSEPTSPEDSPRCLSCSESSSLDGKFVLETPPVSPPVLDLAQLTGLTAADCQLSQPLPKETVFKINASNLKIIKDVEGIKPFGKRTKVILPKEVVKKVVNIKSKPMMDLTHLVPVTDVTSITPVTSISPATSAPQTITLTKPILIPSSHILPTNGIAVGQDVQVKNVQVTSRSQTSIKNPSNVLAAIKQEIDPAQKNDMKLKALKRQQRMIKNRESACLSRKKKKDYVTALETTVSNLEQENARLRGENDILKARVKDLESYFGDFAKPKPFLNSNLRKTTAVLAVLFMVSINIGSLGIISRDSRHSELNLPRPSTGSSTRRIGRSLLWIPDGLDNSTKNLSQGPTCPLRINQTESLRLEKELRSWIAVGEKRVRYHNATKAYHPKKPSLRHLILHSNIPPSFKAQKIRASISAVDFYRPPFPGALPRRDDTFYVFSFSSDHLLVPAVAHNNTLRPKMSFVIPTVPLNDTVIKNGSVPMMQIDCEVLNTVSLQFTEKDFKLFKPLEEEANSKNNQSAEVKMGPPSFKPYFIHRKKFRPSHEYHDSFELNPNRVYHSPHNTFP